MTEVAPYQFHKNIPHFVYPKQGERDTLGQDEPNSAPATQRTSTETPSPANQRTSNQSPAAATQRTADQSPAAVVTRRTSDQSFKSTPPPTVTLPQNTKKPKQSLTIKDKKKKKNPTRTA